MIQDPDRHLPPPDPLLRVGVIVPARNEEDQLPATLLALAEQRDLTGVPLDHRTYEVIVLANNCTDGTAQTARRFAADVQPDFALHVVERTFEPGRAHIGTARRWLMDLACKRLEGIDATRGLIASTDADTRVHPSWLAASLAEVAAGADAVAGLIEMDAHELRQQGASVRRAYLLDQLYRRLKLELEALLDPNPLDPHPGHDFHGGASLAITPAMYRQVGGLPPRPCLEDVALVEALWRADARLVHSRRVRVRTSPRVLGRAEGGQSQVIARWRKTQPDAVISVRCLEAELRDRAVLRRCFVAKHRSGLPGWRPGASELVHLAGRLQVGETALAEVMIRLDTFGWWLEAIRHLRSEQSRSPEPEPEPEPVTVPVAAAIEGLRSRIRAIRREGQVGPAAVVSRGLADS